MNSNHCALGAWRNAFELSNTVVLFYNVIKGTEYFVSL
jgi:hypothetical protein